MSDLKLAYAQFEELESFARFGTRLDESTRRTIDRGRRIRACLKQPQSQPLSMIEQVTVLMALTAGFFDGVDLERVNEAELLLRKAAADITADVAGRVTSGEKLTDADRNSILAIAKGALASFRPLPVASPVVSAT